MSKRYTAPVRRGRDIKKRQPAGARLARGEPTQIFSRKLCGGGCDIRNL